MALVLTLQGEDFKYRKGQQGKNLLLSLKQAPSREDMQTTAVHGMISDIVLVLTISQALIYLAFALCIRCDLKILNSEEGVT